MTKFSRLLAAATAFGLIAGTPAFAQMQSGAMKKEMKMSMADKKMMTKCQGMSHDMMMKDKGCAKMMKMHPDMMKGDMMMKDGMMKKGG